MQINDFIEHPEVLTIIEQLRQLSQKYPEGLTRSKIWDSAGHQYVDLVMEGGGTLGVALVGYIYVLEQLDIRFLQVAGTSAGSIVAMLLAGGGPINLTKSKWLIEKVAGKDFYDFVDGDDDVRRFVDSMFSPAVKKRKKARYTAKIKDEIKEQFGLNPGLHFLEWMTELLTDKGCASVDDLYTIRSVTPDGIYHIDTGDPISPDRWQRVAVVAADITTGTKVAFPEMAPLYWADPGRVNPADFVRASMSVPLFFYPYVARNLPNEEADRLRWASMANYHGPIPPEVYFVDGGAMSNFPIDLFYRPQMVQDAPVFGIKIGADRNSYTSIDSMGDYAGGLLGSMMYFHDNDFLVRYPEYRNVIGIIDTGNYNWLDFHISDEGKLDLFVRGARAARDFLLEYNR